MAERERFEGDVRAAMCDLVAEPVTSGGLFNRVAAGARRRRQVRFSAVAAVAVMLAAAVGLTGVRPFDRTWPAVRIVVPECPSTMPRPLSNPDIPGLHERIVPGTPVLAVICQYAGLNEDAPVWTMTTSRVVRDAELAALVAGANAGERWQGITSCPADTGAEDLAIFVYSDGTLLRVSIHVTGCQSVSNGVIATRLFEDQSVVTIAERQ